MRAMVCRAYGSIDNLGLADVAAPSPGPGQIAIDVHAAGVNFGEMLMVLGQYQEKPPVPFTPGFEVAGTVRALGEGATGFAVGDRVMAALPWGGYAEVAVAAANAVFPIPPGMDFDTAAGFPIAYGTAYGALAWRAQLKPGQTVLVLGAAGGVGLAAVDVAAAIGATVIAAAGDAEKCALTLAHGATHAIDYRREDLRERVHALTADRGVDVVFDPVGGEAFTQALRSIAWGGRILVIGFASGSVPQIPANHVLVKNIDIMGFVWGSYRRRRPDFLTGAFARLMAWYAEGRLRPVISHRLGLPEATSAFRLLRERRVIGKIVLQTRA
jgi:NADPH:quinone reductase